jgi:2-keto-4-pentenoate hydratase/2-oxohepta-3-ene-1,7-dioic acid hydratase in catechol pathway
MYSTDRGWCVGVRTDDGVIKTGLLADAFLRGGIDALTQLRADLAANPNWEFVKEAAITIGPAVPQPGKIICVGLNYRRHALESGMAIPETPVLFSKFNTAITATNCPIPVDATWRKIDYEAELAVVIGRMARHVPKSEALNYVLGYCNANDLSERALQFTTSQWLLGKTLDGFLPLGPYLVTADEIPDPQALGIRGWLNGELRQDSSTADMIFSVAQIIAYVSHYFTLQPGDVISTGTPEGVIFGYPPEKQRWLGCDDEYTVEIDGLGRLSNRLVEED